MTGILLLGYLIENCMKIFSIIEKKYLLHDIVIGANSVVIRDITERGTYVGVPAKKIEKQDVSA